MAARPLKERTETALVYVALRDIPEARRTYYAEQMIRTMALKQVEALELRMAAILPRQNPGLLVSAERARRATRPGGRP